MEDPSISISVLDHGFEFASWIFDVKEAGGDELELIVVPAQQIPKGVKLEKHPRRKFGEFFWGEVGDAMGGGFGRGSSRKDLPSFSVFAQGNNAIGFKDFEG